MFQEWVKEDHITLTANPHYFKGRPQLAAYTYKVMPDQMAMLSQLKTDAIDLGAIALAQAAEAKQLPNLNVVAYDTLNLTYYAYQLDPAKSTLFQDKRVRQALLYAVDRRAIVSSTVYGYGQIAHSVVPSISWAYNPDNQPVYELNRTKAMQLLDEAGWQVGQDGIRIKDGKPLSFTLWTNAGNTARELSIEAMRRAWKDIGVEAKTVTEEWVAFLKRIGATPDGTRDFEMFLVGFGWGIDPNQKMMWHSSSFAPNGFNLNQYTNAEVDKLLDEALNTFDQSKRKELYFTLQAVLAEEVPSPILFFSQQITAYNKRLQGFTPSASGAWNNIHLWRK
jgi:peptide/nickel transport system substrate-binding protein